jgi:hypothetical protein
MKKSAWRRTPGASKRLQNVSRIATVPPTIGWAQYGQLIGSKVIPGLLDSI